MVAHDLASALELILWNIDLASLLNGGIHFANGSSSLDINIPSATPNEILVDARPHRRHRLLRHAGVRHHRRPRRAVVERQLVHVEDIAALDEAEFPLARELSRRWGIRTALAMPLLREGEVIGVINLWLDRNRTHTAPALP